jgi:hypothetical protein
VTVGRLVRGRIWGTVSLSEHSIEARPDFGRWVWRGRALQAEGKLIGTVILSIHSRSAAHHRQELKPKCKRADGASKASWLPATQFFTPCKGTR